jgi:hypothetical protein
MDTPKIIQDRFFIFNFILIAHWVTIYNALNASPHILLQKFKLTEFKYPNFDDMDDRITRSIDDKFVL